MLTFLTDTSRVYYQFVFGDGMGSYRGLPDAAPESTTTDKVLGFTGWMVGYTRDWTERLSSNITYAENALDNSLLQPTDDQSRTTYLAVNSICSPVDRVKVGIEYLYGLLENVDREVGVAHRLQVSFILTCRDRRCTHVHDCWFTLLLPVAGNTEANATPNCVTALLQI